MSDTPYTWRVFKYADDCAANTWREVGIAESKYSYGGPDIQKIGEQYGAGRFMFVKVDAYDVHESQIVAESYYTEATEESAPLAAVES